MADFPTSTHIYASKVDGNTIYADHINALQVEVQAMQVFLAGLATSSYSGTFATTTSWSLLGDRLHNIEVGLVSGAVGSPYFKKTGDTISPTAATVGLTLQMVTGTTNLFESKAIGGTLGFNIDYTGAPKVNSHNVLYVTSSEYVTLTTNISTANSNASTALSTASTANSTANAALAATTVGMDTKLVMAYGLLLAGM